MSHKIPKVSIGLPVFNGETYLRQTLDSLLQQTYTDFELVISDNGSTDATESICREYVAHDARVQYDRHDANRGAAWNYNRVFERARGAYFKWAAADDLCAPTFIERCVEVLDMHADVVLCFSRTQAIDADAEIVKNYPSLLGVDDASPARRFRTMVVGHHPFIPVFGLMRRSVLGRTKLIGRYSGSDRPLVGELALRGRLWEIPESLFYYRLHDQQSWGGQRTRHQQQAWYDPTRFNKITFPHWRLLIEHEHSLLRVPIGLTERMQCQWVMVVWFRRRWRFLANNLLLRDVAS